MDDDWKSVGTNSIIIYLNICIYIIVIVCIYITAKHSNFPPKTIGFLPPVKATMDAGRGASNAPHNLQQLGRLASMDACVDRITVDGYVWHICLPYQLVLLDFFPSSPLRLDSNGFRWNSAAVKMDRNIHIHWWASCPNAQTPPNNFTQKILQRYQYQRLPLYHFAWQARNVIHVALVEAIPSKHSLARVELAKLMTLQITCGCSKKLEKKGKLNVLC